MQRRKPLSPRSGLAAIVVVLGGCSFDSSGLPRRDQPADATRREPGSTRDGSRADGDRGGGTDHAVDQRRDRPPAPDNRPPDNAVPDSRQRPGAPCPCQAHLACFMGVCRTPCTHGPCFQSADCAATEACVLTGSAGEVCLPAGTGKCDVLGQYCQQGYVCVTGRSGSTCRKLCTVSTRGCNCQGTSLPGCDVCY